MQKITAFEVFKYFPSLTCTVKREKYISKSFGIDSYLFFKGVFKTLLNINV